MKNLICIVCPLGCRLSIDDKLNVTGNTCPRGETYAKAELTFPTRVITTTVKIKNAGQKRLPVKTNAPIDKNLMFDVLSKVSEVNINSPIKVGDVIIKDILGTGVDIVSTSNM